MIPRMPKDPLHIGWWGLWPIAGVGFCFALLPVIAVSHFVRDATGSDAVAAVVGWTVFVAVALLAWRTARWLRVRPTTPQPTADPSLTEIEGRLTRRDKRVRDSD